MDHDGTGRHHWTTASLPHQCHHHGLLLYGLKVVALELFSCRHYYRLGEPSLDVIIMTSYLVEGEVKLEWCEEFIVAAAVDQMTDTET